MGGRGMSVKVINEQGSSRNLQIDALKMCPPIGAMYASFGVHGCLPMSHGASGCCRFQRMELAKHFNRLVHVSSTLLDENAAIFGGETSLEEAIPNAFEAYDPQIIAVHTTCLSETIGDDLSGIIRRVPDIPGKYIVHCSTPGYAGAQLMGYAAMSESLIRQLAVPVASRTDEVALIGGWLNPCDLDVLEKYARPFFSRVTVTPDQRGIMDRTPSRDERRYLAGGSKVEDIARLAGSPAIVALGAEAAWGGGEALDEIARSQGMSPVFEKIALPIGINATDRYVEALSKASGRSVPFELADARAACVEKLMILHPKLFGKRVVLATDADIAVPLAEYLASIGMRPEYVAVGWASDDFADRMNQALEPYDIDMTVNPHADRYDIEEYMNDHPVDLLIGETREKILARRFGIPLVRVGFPVVDRPLSFLSPIVGYGGALHLLRSMLCALAENGEADVAPENLSIAETF